MSHALDHLRAARRMIPHYWLAVFTAGYTLTQAPTILGVMIDLVWWVDIVCTMAGIVVMVASFAGMHDLDTCPRCVQLRPGVMQRLDALDVQGQWRHLRWQHRQPVIALYVTLAPWLVGATLSIAFHDRGGDYYRAACIALIIPPAIWASIWWTRHQPYRGVCPWCIRFVAVRILCREFRKVRREITANLVAKPAAAESVEPEAASEKAATGT